MDLAALLAITGGGLAAGSLHNNLMKAQNNIRQEYKL
jgi:hypothetical protein